ncbi:MFS transporter [Paenibacillus lautus]|uniref:MFS transporter n=1 Tax=Paenibacillus lautus TaxID=1401 RepID=A0A385TH00_PAELA|nr:MULTISPECIES: MFS transporter [Paenibacillus]MBY0163286.1 MFS transporter [Cytobacillus firmus]VTR21422.1 tetracycline resistance protein, class G [Actinobacillus pleuropneumoniae]AYB41914.1 MFS transporter [Paenibacillus lautus]MCM3261583.1 MFS transporter [Paenibacillus lautus]QOT09864.1 MFS transporter [Paenibacillus sp. JNUCC-32]
MESWKKNLWILWFGSFIVSSSFSMVIPFLPLFLIELGVTKHTELWSGLLFSSAFFAGALSSPFWGAVGDKYGRKPMIIRAGLVLFVIYVLMAFVTNEYQVLILRLLQGLLSGFIPGAIAIVGTNTPEKKVGYALSMMSTATATGGIMGPMIGGTLASLFSNRMAFGLAGMLCFAATLLVIFWVKEEKFVPSKERVSVMNTFKVAGHNKALMTVLMLTVLTQFSVMTIEPVLPLYIAQIGGSSSHTSMIAGFVFSIVGIASILFAARWGRLADKIGFQKVLLIGLLASGIGSLAQILFSNIWAFSAIRFAYGAFFCAVFPALNGLVVKHTPSEFRGRAFSLNQTANQIGGMAGPLAGGMISGIFNIHSVFLMTGVLMLITTAITYWTMRPSRGQPVEKGSLSS